MAIDVTTDGDEKTLTLTYTRNGAKMSVYLDDAARHLYPVRSAVQVFETVDDEGVLVEYDDLTNAQKLNVIDWEVKNHIKNCAKTYHVTNAVDTAKDTASTEADTRYE